MSKVFRILFLLVTIASTQTVSALTKTSSALISLATGTVAGVLVYDRLHRSLEEKMSYGGIFGFCTSVLTYRILSHYFVKEELCSICGECQNNGSHSSLWSAKVIANCGHSFYGYCIRNYMQKSNDRKCPVCKMHMFDLFAVMEQPDGSLRLFIDEHYDYILGTRTIIYQKIKPPKELD